MKKKEQNVVRGYKAFDKDFKCRDFQYEVGKTYEEKEAELCFSGFHFCLNPLDTLNYYDVCEAQFAEVEAEDVSDKTDSDSKRVSKKITIKAKLDFPMFVKASIDFLMDFCNKGDDKKVDNNNFAQLASSGYSAKLASSGDFAQLASSGYSAQLASSGYSAQLASSGYSAQLASKGQDSIVAGIGINNIGKGAIGNWLVLAEWEYSSSLSRYIPKCVKSEKIDGEKLKADTYYKLENSEFTVCE